MIDLPVPSLLHTVNIEHDRNRAEHHNEEAHIRQNRSIGNKQLAQLRFSQHPHCSQDHAPSQVLQIKSCLVYNIEHQTDDQHDQSGKQHSAGNQSYHKIAAKYIAPDI